MVARAADSSGLELWANDDCPVPASVITRLDATSKSRTANPLPIGLSSAIIRLSQSSANVCNKWAYFKERVRKPRLSAWKKFAIRHAVLSRRTAFAAKLARPPNAAGRLSGDRLIALPMVADDDTK